MTAAVNPEVEIEARALVNRKYWLTSAAQGGGILGFLLASLVAYIKLGHPVMTSRGDYRLQVSVLIGLPFGIVSWFVLDKAVSKHVEAIRDRLLQLPSRASFDDLESTVYSRTPARGSSSVPSLSYHQAKFILDCLSAGIVERDAWLQRHSIFRSALLRACEARVVGFD